MKSNKTRNDEMKKRTGKMTLQPLFQRFYRRVSEILREAKVGVKTLICTSSNDDVSNVILPVPKVLRRSFENSFCRSRIKSCISSGPNPTSNSTYTGIFTNIIFLAFRPSGTRQGRKKHLPTQGTYQAKVGNHG